MTFDVIAFDSQVMYMRQSPAFLEIIEHLQAHGKQ